MKPMNPEEPEEPRDPADPAVRADSADSEGSSAEYADGGPVLVGVGVGPGDPELVTVKGVNALRGADTVVVPVMERGGTGRAEATVLHYVDASKVVRVVFALNERSDRARREAAWDAAGGRVAELLRGGGTVAFATIGDPNVYSTFGYLAQTVAAALPELDVRTVPGVTAMQDLAARSGAVLTEGTEPLTLVPVTAGLGVLREALAGPGTVVAYKFGRQAAQVADALRESGRTEGAVWGSALGLPGESITPAAEPAAEPGAGPWPVSAALPYLSTLIAPARRDSRGGKL